MKFTSTKAERIAAQAYADFLERYDKLPSTVALRVLRDLARLLHHLETTMPLFACKQCNTVENTALCNYWPRSHRREEPLCSACDPTIGQWHGQFERRSATGMQIDQLGFLWTKEVVALGGMPKGYTIVGEAP